MEYSIDAFTDRLLTMLRDNVPFENPDLSKSKHPNRNGMQLRDLFDIKGGGAFNTGITMNIDMREFEIGSPMQEALMPHYHILQQAQVIRKKGRGTKQSKGSQDKLPPIERDYERVIWNGKTFSKEYSKNVRGARSKASKIKEPKLKYSGGKYYEDKRGMSGSYVNVHYQYIDRILDAVVPYLAQEFGMRAMRKQDYGLEEEYNYQLGQESEERFGILDILNSFEE